MNVGSLVVFGNYESLVLRTFLSMCLGLQEFLWIIYQEIELQLY